MSLAASPRLARHLLPAIHVHLDSLEPDRAKSRRDRSVSPLPERHIEPLLPIACSAVDAIWGPKHVSPFTPPNCRDLPISVFVTESFRRSHLDPIAFQLALFYLGRASQSLRLSIRSHAAIPSKSPFEPDRALCGRRMFLCSLILASKYLNDRPFSMKTWSVISGLTIQDLNASERRLLQVIKHTLYVDPRKFDRWRLALDTSTFYYELDFKTVTPITKRTTRSISHSTVSSSSSSSTTNHPPPLSPASSSSFTDYFDRPPSLNRFSTDSQILVKAAMARARSRSQSYSTPSSSYYYSKNTPTPNTTTSTLAPISSSSSSSHHHPSFTRTLSLSPSSSDSQSSASPSSPKSRRLRPQCHCQSCKTKSHKATYATNPAINVFQ